MNKLFKLAAMCVAAVVSESVALAGGNEPDTYVERFDEAEVASEKPRRGSQLYIVR